MARYIAPPALLAAVLASAATLPTIALAQEPLELRLGYAQNSQPVKDALALFGKLVEEKSDGSLRITYFPDSQLGGEGELVELMQTGAIDITKVSGGLMESFSPLYSVFSMPYLFDNQEHFFTVMNDPDIMDEVYQSTANQGFVGFGWYDSGQRNFYTKDTPIQTVDDLAGMKIRVMQSQTAVDAMKLLGASPVVMAQEEVYTALQQGILDGAENNEFALTFARHGEVVDYFALDGHTRVPDILLINRRTYERLSDDQRTLLREAARESTDFQIGAWAAAIAEARVRIQGEFGVTITDVDKASFQAAVQPMYEALKDRPPLYGLYQKIAADREVASPVQAAATKASPAAVDNDTRQ
ncbi:TRAP transporter substrate-binding protein [Halomonas sp. V046]|uniref:TRAP transporter substrate-binding protein n=1 Tax=Halomonas sp. V046 TaxID=3459611 RepID=UPI004043ACDB